MKLRLWVEVCGEKGALPPTDDMVIFVAVNKIDKEGRGVPFRGSVGNDQDMVTRGFCRVSRRELDEKASTEWHPVLAGTSHQPLKPGEIVSVDIGLYPSSTFFFAGESMELIVSANEIIPSPPYRKNVDCNKGIQRFHLGGQHDSHLLIPIIPAKAT